MITLPPKPQPGQPISATEFGRLIDYVRSITPRQSASVRVSTGTEGTTFEATPRQGGSSAPQEATEEADLPVLVEYDLATGKLQMRMRKAKVIWVETEEEADAREPVEIIQFEEYSV